jgi:hypothetical protein
MTPTTLKGTDQTLLSRDEARRIVNIAKLPELLRPI